MKISNLLQSTQEVNDPRRQYGNLRHVLVNVLVIGLITIICGGKDFEDMGELGKTKQKWLSGFLHMPWGAPCEDTFRRVFERINPDELSKCLNGWLLSERGYPQIKTVSLDGKTVRGSCNCVYRDARHIVSAWASEYSITLGQVTVDEKSNEITAIPLLLDVLDIKGAVVTIDAMGCQKDIAAKIYSKEAHYLFTLKANS
jgi:hypothetical protein